MAMNDKGSWWSVTINNPTEVDYASLDVNDAPSFVKKVKFQTEQGKEGTLHIQAAVQTTQVRFSAMKKWLPRAHIEVARDKSALLKYVEKQDTAVADGPKSDASREYITMEKALVKVAHVVEELSEQDMLLHDYNTAQIYANEYWKAVRILLRDEPHLVSVLTNPQTLRAWVNTRQVWISKVM